MPKSFLELTVIFTVAILVYFNCERLLHRKKYWLCCDKYFLSDLEIRIGHSTYTVFKKELRLCFVIKVRRERGSTIHQKLVTCFSEREICFMY